MKQSIIYNIVSASYLLAGLFFIQFLDRHVYMALILIIASVIGSYCYSGLADDIRREEVLLDDLFINGTGND